jgi:hypothetical protein
MEKKEILSDYELIENNPLLVNFQILLNILLLYTCELLLIKLIFTQHTPIDSQDIKQNQSLCNNSSSLSPCLSKTSNDINTKQLRIERKKMLNRKAAARLRQKKKKEIKELQDSNNNLKDEIEKMEFSIMKLRQQIMEIEIEEE